MRFGRTPDMAGHLQALRSRAIEAFLPPRGRVLEIGPGEGTFGRRGCDWVALNISLRGGANVLGDGQRLPFRAASFDAVIAMEVLEHVRFPYRLLSEIRRAVRPDGRVLLSTPNVATPVNRAALLVAGRFPDDETLHRDPDVGHIHFFTWRSLGAALRAEGFRIVANRSGILQFLPGRYLYDTGLERAWPALAKDLILELAPA